MRYEDSFDTDPWQNINNPMPDPVSNPPMRIAYEYDLLGRKVRETMTPGTDLVYQTHYDSEGRVEIYESPQGDLLYEYDSVTGLKKATTSYPAAKTPEQIRDDAAATPTPYLASTTRTVYTYDDLGRLSTVDVVRRNGVAVSEYPTTYAYNKNGSQEKVIYPNVDSQNNHVGNEAVYEYDGLNRLVRLTNYKDSNRAENQLLSRFEYSCYANGQRATATETRTGWQWTGSTNIQNGRPQREIVYRYDGLGRLIWEKRTGNDPNSFVYDLVGNKVSQTIGKDVDRPGVNDNETTDYSYNERDQLYQEVLHKDGLDFTITYDYDANGSLTSQTTFRSNGIKAEEVGYGYDLRGRLQQVTITPYDTNGNPGTSVVTQYAYDPSGNRVGKVSGSTTTSYLIDPANPTGYSQVLQETTGSSTTTYILGGDVIGQAVGSAGPEYLLYDGHGSVRNHAKTDGTLVWYDLPDYNYSSSNPTQDYTQFSYDAWGQECRRPTGEGLYYCGEMFDPSLKMYNLRARWYNPANGRFNALDPYAGSSYDPQSLHKYLYCHADPINRIDLNGQWCLVIDFLSAFNLQERLKNIKDHKDLIIKRGIDEVKDELKDAFDWSDPKPIPEVAQIAETLWVGRLRMLGLNTIPLQSSPIGEHGPDLFSFGLIRGKFHIIIGEVKGMKRSRIKSSFDKLNDGTLQMASRWVQKYIEQIADPLVSAVVEAGAGYLAPDTGKLLREGLEHFDFGLYLLRARYYTNGAAGTWKLRGFHLMQVDMDGKDIDVAGSLDSRIEQEFVVDGPGIIP